VDGPALLQPETAQFKEMGQERWPWSQWWRIVPHLSNTENEDDWPDRGKGETLLHKEGGKSIDLKEGGRMLRV